MYIYGAWYQTEVWLMQIFSRLYLRHFWSQHFPTEVRKANLLNILYSKIQVAISLSIIPHSTYPQPASSVEKVFTSILQKNISQQNFCMRQDTLNLFWTFRLIYIFEIPVKSNNKWSDPYEYKYSWGFKQSSLAVVSGPHEATETAQYWENARQWRHLKK